MKNASDGLIRRLNTAEETLFEHEDMTTETPKTEKQREKRLKNKTKQKNPEQKIQELWKLVQLQEV